MLFAERDDYLFHDQPYWLYFHPLGEVFNGDDQELLKALGRWEGAEQVDPSLG